MFCTQILIVNQNNY